VRALHGGMEVFGRVVDRDGYGEGGREAQGCFVMVEGAGLRPERECAIGEEEEEEREEEY
jgi:hypothetical protein